MHLEEAIESPKVTVGSIYDIMLHIVVAHQLQQRIYTLIHWCVIMMPMIVIITVK